MTRLWSNHWRRSNRRSRSRRRRARGVGLVRRPTGGSAIYHDGPERELTYSVAATAADLGIGEDLLETYRWIGAALLRGLQALGAPAELVPERPPAGQ